MKCHSKLTAFVSPNDNLLQVVLHVHPINIAVIVACWKEQLLARNGGYGLRKKNLPNAQGRDILWTVIVPLGLHYESLHAAVEQWA